MTISRAVGGLLLLVALLALGADAVTAWTGGGFAFAPLGRRWFEVHPASLNLVQALVQRYLHPLLWDPGIVFLLRWPAWLFFGLLGALLLFRIRPRAHA